MDIVIKPMETEDEIRGKAHAHWRSWQETYPGLIDAAYLENITLEACEKIAFQWPGNLLVAKDGERVVGFAGYGACRDGDLPHAGEVFALYVLREYQGRGLGRALMQAAMDRLQAYDAVAVWVLEGNERAIGFYRRMGFRQDARREIRMGAPTWVCRMLSRPPARTICDGRGEPGEA